MEIPAAVAYQRAASLLCRPGPAGRVEPAGEENTAAALQTWRATSLQHFGWAPSGVRGVADMVRAVIQM